MATAPTTPTTYVARRNHAKLFPLHLAPIDAFFCLDDRHGYPMMSVIQIEFSGEMERSSFEQALQLSLGRHPLLAAHVRPAKRGKPCWVAADNPMPRIDWREWGAAIAVDGDGGFDLQRETGLRFWIRSGEGRTHVTMQVHHACTDGTGVYRFLGDLLAAYAYFVAPETGEPELTPLVPALLKKRRHKMAHVAVNESSWRFTLHGLRQALSLFGRRIRPLAEPRHVNDTSGPEIFPGIHTARFSRNEHQALRDVASRHGATLNDLLMAEMFRTIQDWNAAHGARRGNPWLRIMMPFDMRDKEDYEMPAANMTAYTFITRRANQCDDRAALLSSIRDETSKIKNGRLGSSFIDSIMLAEFAPWLLKFLLGRNKCIASTILSNIGDPSKRFTAKLTRRAGKVVAGNLVLEDVTGVPPLRPGSHATLAIFSYGRELAISVRCNPACFRAESSSAFLELYAENLRSHLVPNAN